MLSDAIQTQFNRTHSCRLEDTLMNILKCGPRTSARLVSLRARLELRESGHAKGRDNDGEDPEDGAADGVDIGFDDARGEHQEHEGEVAEADDEETDEVGHPGRLFDDHPRDEQREKAISADVEAKVEQEV